MANAPSTTISVNGLILGVTPLGVGALATIPSQGSSNLGQLFLIGQQLSAVPEITAASLTLTGSTQLTYTLTNRGASGAAAGKGRRTGLEPVNKIYQRPRPPEPYQIPLPPFVSRQQPDQRPPLEIVDARAIPDLQHLQDQVHASEDFSDVSLFLQDNDDLRDVTELLDGDLEDVLALLD